MKDLIRSVLEEFKGVKTALAVVHNSPSLGVLLDELLEKGLLSPAKRRRQGMRGLISCCEKHCGMHEPSQKRRTPYERHDRLLRESPQAQVP